MDTSPSGWLKVNLIEETKLNKLRKRNIFRQVCAKLHFYVVSSGMAAESDGSEEAAEAVENLLESYFMQIDGTYDRLVSICEPSLAMLLLPCCHISHISHT